MSEALALRELPDRIRAEHELAVGSARTAVEHAARCGALLAEAKTEVGHGGWAKWVEEHCVFSARTARGYMQLATAIKVDGPNRQRVAELPLREALKALAEPKPRAAPSARPAADPEPAHRKPEPAEPKPQPATASDGEEHPAWIAMDAAVGALDALREFARGPIETETLTRAEVALVELQAIWNHSAGSWDDATQGELL